MLFSMVEVYNMTALLGIRCEEVCFLRVGVMKTRKNRCVLCALCG